MLPQILIDRQRTIGLIDCRTISTRQLHPRLTVGCRRSDRTVRTTISRTLIPFPCSLYVVCILQLCCDRLPHDWIADLLICDTAIFRFLDIRRVLYTHRSFLRDRSDRRFLRYDTADLRISCLRSNYIQRIFCICFQIGICIVLFRIHATACTFCPFSGFQCFFRGLRWNLRCILCCILDPIPYAFICLQFKIQCRSARCGISPLYKALDDRIHCQLLLDLCRYSFLTTDEAACSGYTVFRFQSFLDIIARWRIILIRRSCDLLETSIVFFSIPLPASIRIIAYRHIIRFIVHCAQLLSSGICTIDLHISKDTGLLRFHSQIRV